MAYASRNQAKQVNNWRQKLLARRERLDVIRAYGGRCECDCDCPTEPYPEFLEIHHALDNGKIHRKQLNGTRLAWWLKNQGFPRKINLGDGVRDRIIILCSNCHMAKSRFDYCPRNTPPELRMYGFTQATLPEGLESEEGQHNESEG